MKKVIDLKVGDLAKYPWDKEYWIVLAIERFSDSERRIKILFANGIIRFIFGSFKTEIEIN